MAKRDFHSRTGGAAAGWLVMGLALGLRSVAWAGATGEAPVRSACEVAYPPFCIVHQDGRADGFSVELLRAVVGKMGRDVTFRTGLWEEVRGWLACGEVACLPLAGRTPEREQHFDFTVPYLTMHGAIVVRTNTADVRSLADLRGRRVGVMKGDNAEEFLRRTARGFAIITTPTFPDAFRALADGRCDAVVIQRLVAVRLLEETGLRSLKIVDRPIPDFAQDFCFAVKEGDRQMLALLNEGLALAVADGTLRRLHARWFAYLELPPDRPIIVGGDHNYPPFEFLDKNGQPAGYNVDLIRAVAKAVGLDIRIRLGSWSAVMRALERGDIDVLQGMFYSPARDRTFDFSQAHIVNHCVSVVHADAGAPPATRADLEGKRIVVQHGDIMHDFCVEHGLTNQLTTVDAQDDALRALAAGQHDCALVARMTAFYWKKREGWNNLVVGRVPLASPEYCFGVPAGNRALLAQLSEGLTAIADSKDYRRIHEKWMGVYEPGISSRAVVRHVAIVAGPLLVIALLALLWSWSLRRQVAARTRELRESLERYRHTLDGMLEGCQIITPAWTYAYANEAAARQGRKRRDELLGRTMMAVYPGIEQSPLFAVLQECLHQRVARRFDNEFAYPDGTVGHFELSVEPVPEGVFVLSVDITERKQAEEKLRHLADVLRAIRNVNQLIVHEEDRAALVRQVCDILTETRGYRTAWIVLHDRAGAAVLAAEAGLGAGAAHARAALAHGAWPACCQKALAGTDVVVIRNPAGDCVPCPLARTFHNGAVLAGALRHGACEYGVLVVSLPLSVADDPEEQSLFQELAGDIAYALHGIEKEAERRESEQTVRAMFDGIHDGILMADAASRRVLNANGTICRMLGYDLAELLGMTLDDIHPPEQREHVAAEFARQARGETALASNIPVRRKDGSVFPADISATILELHQRRCVLGVFRDITARLRLESQFQQAQKLESVGRLAGGVAHDFNNFLMGIMGYVELCQDSVSADHPIQQWLDEIMESAQRSANLTRQLLAFARKQTIEPRVVDLNDAIAGLLKLLRRLIGEDISLAWVPAAEVWPVKIDPGQIDQILANLTVNARDAIAGVGRITIETKNARVDADYCVAHAEAAPGEYAMLVVSDNGCGMDRATLDKVFEPFFTTKAPGQGTGLGLATAHGIVKQNGGFINVYSEPGTGTTFRIYLPRHVGAPQTVPPAGETAPGGTETVLLVEDEKSVRVTTTLFLEVLGYTVLTAPNPNDALRLAAEHPGTIHLLITDVVMPGMSGRALAARLLETHPNIQCLYISGYTANVIAHQGILDDGVHFLAKPFARDALAKKVREVLSGR